MTKCSESEVRRRSSRVKLEGISKSESSKVNNKWTPPASPYHLIQEELYSEPWKLLISTIFLSKSKVKNEVTEKVMFKFFDQWKTADSAAEAEWTDIAEFIRALPAYEKKAQTIVRFSQEFVGKDWSYPRELFGIGKYGDDCYRLFCLGEWREVTPDDQFLNYYHDWLLTNRKVIGIK